jgi:hypothetical protein
MGLKLKYFGKFPLICENLENDPGNQIGFFDGGSLKIIGLATQSFTSVKENLL